MSRQKVIASVEAVSKGYYKGSIIQVGQVIENWEGEIENGVFPFWLEPTSDDYEVVQELGENAENALKKDPSEVPGDKGQLDPEKAANKVEPHAKKTAKKASKKVTKKVTKKADTSLVNKLM